MRRGPFASTKDTRRILGRRIRRSEPSPLRFESNEKEDLYYHEAQTSSLSWGPDEWFWTEIFLVDTYCVTDPEYATYLDPSLPGDGEGSGVDPPLAGSGSLKYNPYFDPRDYYLCKLVLRIDQVEKEYTALAETFNSKMECYVSEPVARFYLQH